MTTLALLIAVFTIAKHIGLAGLARISFATIREPQP